MPDRALISFDYPNMGDSDPLTKVQKSTKEKDSYFAVAEAQLRILQDMGITKINTFGISMGGYAAITVAALAHKYGIDVENVIAIGTPGVEKVSNLSLGLHEMKELSNLNIYHSSPAAPDMYAATHIGDELKPTPPPTEALKNDPFFRYGRAMAKMTIPQRAGQFLTTQASSRLLLMSGSEDTVGRLGPTTEIVKNLQDTFGNDRVSRIVMEGQGHLAMVHPKILAPLINSQLEGSLL